MPIFDQNRNHIDTTLFETYLSKVIVENTIFFKPVFIKINETIDHLINSNKANNRLDRALYALFSDLTQRFPKYAKMSEFYRSDWNVQANTEFHKMFFELRIVEELTASMIKSKKNTPASLSQLTQEFIGSNPVLLATLKKKLRPDHLFLEENRGRIELEDTVETKKLGIATRENTPKDLLNYFEVPFTPAQMQFARDTNSFFSKWLEKRNLPFISGPSGTLEIIFTSIIKLASFTPNELKAYFMGVAGALVSRGHHSFAEVIIVANKLGFNLCDYQSRELFYEQFLTEDFISSDAYRKFRKIPFIQQYYSANLDTVDLDLALIKPFK